MAVKGPSTSLRVRTAEALAVGKPVGDAVGAEASTAGADGRIGSA